MAPPPTIDMIMRTLNRVSAEAFLASQGVPHAEVVKILTGFDLRQPIYEHDFWPDDVLFQLIRLPSATDPTPLTGNWFGLLGITSTGVAVNDGLAGRRCASFKVISHFKALEGTAAPFTVNLQTGIGGGGGATQIYIPRSLLGHLTSIGPTERR